MVVTLKYGSNLKAMNDLLKKLLLLRAAKGIDAKKYCGIIHLSESSISNQNKMRDE